MGKPNPSHIYATSFPISPAVTVYGAGPLPARIAPLPPCHAAWRTILSDHDVRAGRAVRCHRGRSHRPVPVPASQSRVRHGTGRQPPPFPLLASGSAGDVPG